MVHFLDFPVVEVLRKLDAPFVEQVIAAPKISFDRVLLRSAARRPQTAEQLVEVPTERGYVFAIIATKAVGWRGAAALAEQLVTTPVPQGRQGGRGGLHDSRAGQGSPAAVVKQIVDIPYPQGRRGGEEVFKLYALDRIQQQRTWSRSLIFQLVAVFKVFSQAKVLPHRVDCLKTQLVEFKGFSRFSPAKKKRGVYPPVESQSPRQCQLIRAERSSNGSCPRLR